MPTLWRNIHCGLQTKKSRVDEYFLIQLSSRTSFVHDSNHTTFQPFVVVSSENMEQDCVLLDAPEHYPILVLPKKCTTLEGHTEPNDNVFIDLTITSLDTEGNRMCIYSGFCNVKLIDNYPNLRQSDSPRTTNTEYFDSNGMPITIADDNQNILTSPTQSQVWIDPVRSPYVYNRYDATELRNRYTVCQQNQTNHITVEQHNTYITQKIYNSNETVCCPSEFEHKKFGKVQMTETVSKEIQSPLDHLYEEDEYQCGVFLSQLSEEIINEKEIKEREERKYVGIQTGNSALKQLMSPKIQSISKQRRTILFLGHKSECGQTIQKIAVNDPSLECSGDGIDENDFDSVFDQTNEITTNQKKYQCEKCQRIFEQISTFKQHIGYDHRNPKPVLSLESKITDFSFTCIDCGKCLKNREKFELHCLAHGDPELECDECRKVFASKFTLRTHRKIHTRQHRCTHCDKTFDDKDTLTNHAAKKHKIFVCETCAVTFESHGDLADHAAEIHRARREKGAARNEKQERKDSSSETTTEQDWRMSDDEDSSQTEAERAERNCDSEKIRDADAVIAKVMSNRVFLLHAKKARRLKKYNKVCEVCQKAFDRIGDLKRHLIEHVVKSSLTKTHANKDGILHIQCEICQVESFNKIDRYKAHLREHAKLTLYKCTFCDKSFSDSSNFSKHKKIHGATYLQCDLCGRKFNSKKMISQHMEYHNRHAPIPCKYCGKCFHFESTLNKHIKSTHNKTTFLRVRCRICRDHFTTLKQKWDHEWNVHKIRKMIVDCLVCGAKFRKYTELKHHCIVTHKMEIPTAKKLLNDKADPSDPTSDT